MQNTEKVANRITKQIHEETKC